MPTPESHIRCGLLSKSGMNTNHTHRYEGIMEPNSLDDTFVQENELKVLTTFPI